LPNGIIAKSFNDTNVLKVKNKTKMKVSINSEKLEELGGKDVLQAIQY